MASLDTGRPNTYNQVVSNVVLIFLRCSLKIESLRSFSKQCVGLPLQNPFAHVFGEGVPSQNHPHGPFPYHELSLDPQLVIVIMYFQIKVRKRFIGDILQIVMLDFSADILTECKIWCPGLVQEKLWSA